MTEQIPQFLEETQQIQETEDQKNSPLLLKTFAIIGGIWFMLTFIYLQFFFGWEAFSSLMPSDFVLFLAAFFIFPVIIFLVVILFRKSYSTLQQNAMVEKTLNRFLKTNDENLLSKIINKALQNQIEELNSTLQFLSAQTDSLKATLQTKAEDFDKISESLDKTAKQNLARIDENKNAYIDLCRTLSTKAQETAGTLETHTKSLQSAADDVYQKLNPLIDETMVTADHLKTVVCEAEASISQTKTGLAEFEQMGQNSMNKLSKMLSDETSRFEKALLNTADSCQQIYQKIDSGISHIENSLKTHKEMASEQSALLDKNATFLDNKLGEYGKLISMEVAAMIERAGTLDMNVKSQVDALKDASTQISTILDGANNSLALKSSQVISNINSILAGLSSEVDKISEFIRQTAEKNSEIEQTTEKISDRIGRLSSDLKASVDDLQIRSVEAVDKFNQVGAVLQKNTALLSENTNTVIQKSKQGADFILTQNEAFSKTAQSIDEIKKQIALLESSLAKTGEKSVTIFEKFKEQMNGYKKAFEVHFADLEKKNTESQKKLEGIEARYQELSLNDFVKKMNEMVANLENLSVNLNAFFDKDSEDDLWKKFYDGDHGAFAHHIVKKLGRKDVIKIQNLYEKDVDFRKLSDAYMREFEILLGAAEKTEKPETMIAILSSSEIGKIYYIIARALNKLS